MGPKLWTFVLEKELFSEVPALCYSCCSLCFLKEGCPRCHCVTIPSSLAKGGAQWPCTRRHLAVSLPRPADLCLSHCASASPRLCKRRGVRLQLVAVRILSPVLQSHWSPRTFGSQRTAIFMWGVVLVFSPHSKIFHTCRIARRIIKPLTQI